MTRSKRKSGRDGGLSGDDAALWSHVAQSVKRVRVKDRVPDVDVSENAAARVFKAAATKATSAERDKSSVLAAPPNPPAKSAKAPPLQDFESKKARRIGRGQIEIDARIDLHGHTQAEAHHMLVAFIRRCHAQDKRTVLVITGKGKPGGRGDFLDAGGRGVLRRVVPQWLAASDLRSYVIGFTAAHVRHGGEGALYVQVRRK